MTKEELQKIYQALTEGGCPQCGASKIERKITQQLPRHIIVENLCKDCSSSWESEYELNTVSQIHLSDIYWHWAGEIMDELFLKVPPLSHKKILDNIALMLRKHHKREQEASLTFKIFLLLKQLNIRSAPQKLTETILYHIKESSHDKVSQN